MPILYQPKFCCHCGEAIERVDWRLWTSRRFCDVCESVQKRHELLPRVVLAVGLFGGLFGISGFMERPAATEPSKPLQIVSARAPSPAAKQNPTAVNTAGADRPLTLPAASKDQSPTPNQDSTAPIPNKAKAAESEAVYFCGAATRKGTPCSRRVKTPGRCWQHVGQPPMIADTKMPRAR
jgi:hypothetical protein